MFAVTLTAFSPGIVSRLFMVTCVCSVQRCGPAFHLWFGYLCSVQKYGPAFHRWFGYYCLFCPEVWASFPSVVWLLLFVLSRSVGQLSTCGLVTTVLSRSVGQLSTCGLVTTVCSVQKCGPAFHLWFGYYCLFCPEVWANFPPVVWLLLFVLSRSVGQLSICGMVTSVLNWHRVEEFCA